MERVALVIASIATPLFFACDAPFPCAHLEPLSRDGGGELSCIKSEDCPRPSNVYICLQNHDETRTCVECIDTVCRSRTPVKCPDDGGKP